MVILRQRMRAKSDKSDEVPAALAEIIPSARAASSAAENDHGSSCR